MGGASAAGPERLVLAVPLLNEEALVDGVVEELLHALRSAPVPFRLVLVDNGSTDRTGERVDALAAAHPEVLPLHLATNQGYGGGILDGVYAGIAAFDPTMVGWAWGDGQVDPGVLPELVAACIRGAELAKVVRRERQDGLHRWLITRAYHLALRGMKRHVPDVNGCPKVLRRATFEALAPQERGWCLDPEVVLTLHARGATIAERPAVMRPRAGGRSKVRAATLLEFVRFLRRWSPPPP